MSDLSILLLAFAVPVGILLVRYAFREFRDRLHWHRMRKNLVDIVDMYEERERCHQFLREDGNKHKVPLPKVREMFQGIWKDTRYERENR